MLKDLKAADKNTQERFLNIAGLAQSVKDEFFAVKTIESRREEILKDAQNVIVRNTVLEMLRNPIKYPEASKLFDNLVDARINALGIDGRVATAEKNAKEYTDKIATAKLKEGTTYIDQQISGVKTRIEEVAITTNKNTLDVTQISVAFDWVDAFTVDGKPCGKIPILKFGNLPQDVTTGIEEIKTNMPKDKDGKFIPVASQVEVDEDANNLALLSDFVLRVDNKADLARDAAGAVALGKKDRALVCTYASLIQDGGEAKAKAWFESHGKVEKFDGIKKLYEETVKRTAEADEAKKK